MIDILRKVHSGEKMEMWPVFFFLLSKGHCVISILSKSKTNENTRSIQRMQTHPRLWPLTFWSWVLSSHHRNLNFQALSKIERSLMVFFKHLYQLSLSSERTYQIKVYKLKLTNDLQSRKWFFLNVLCLNVHITDVICWFLTLTPTWHLAL